MPVFNNVLAGAAGSGGGADYQIERSLRFNSADSAHLNRSFSAGTTTTFTISLWVKRTEFSQATYLVTAGTGTQGYLNFDAGIIRFWGGNNGGDLKTNAVYRDPSAWYHIIAVADTTNSEVNDRMRLYVNGVRLTNANGDFQTHTQPGDSVSLGDWNSANTHYVNRLSTGNHQNFYLADFHFVDGQALDETSFGAFDDNGVWQPIKFTGSHNSTPTVTYPAVYVSSPGTYGTVTDVNTVNGSVFTSAGSTGAGSIKVVFASAITGVTNVKFKGGGYALSSSFNIKVNGSVTHQNLSTNSSYSVRTENFTTPIDITSFEIVSASDGWALGDLQFSTDGTNFTAPSGTAAVIPDAGVNGFHLDFADGSDLGNDAAGSNNWTANNLVGTIPDISTDDVTVFRDNAVYAAGNPEHLFDSNKSTYSYAGTNNASNYVDWSPTGGYETSGHIWIQGGNGSGGGCDSMTVTINGSTVTRSAVVDNETYSQAGYGWGDWHKYTVSGNTLNSLRVTGAYALVRQLSTVADPTHSVLGISNDNDVPVIEIIDPANLDLLRDSPTSGDPAGDTEAGGVLSGNYCTWNPLTIRNGNGTMQLLDGNLNFGDQGTSSRYGSVIGTLAVNSGKWFVECTFGSGSGMTTNVMFGLVPVEKDANYTAASRQNVTGMIALQGHRAFKKGGTSVDNYASGIAIGDTVSVAFDCDNGTSTWYLNGTSLGTFPHTFDTQYSWTPCAIDWSNGTPGSSYILNCGQRPFSMTPPTGYKALCTANLPDVTNGSAYFDTKTWEGTGSTLSITGYEFSPDLVWIKNRTDSSSHHIYDTVRGVEKRLASNSSSGEDDFGSSNPGSSLTSFNSDGFTVGDFNGINGSSDAMVAWAWDGGDLAVASDTTNYNQSQTWSDDMSTSNGWTASRDGIKAFDSNTSLISGVSNTWAQTDTTGGTVTWTPNGYTIDTADVIYVKGISSSDRLTVVGSSSTQSNIAPGTVDGVSNVYTVPTTLGTVNSLSVTNSAGLAGFSGIKVGGKVLIDAGVIPAGGLNSSFYNQSQTWSTYGTFDNRYSGFEWDDVFNEGNGANANDALYVNNNTLGDKWTLTQSVAVTSSVKVYAQNTVELVINAGLSDETSVSGGASNQFKYIEVPFSGNVASVTVKSSGAYVMGIWFDGLRLIDDTESPTNVPSIASTYRANPSAGFSIVTWTGTGSAGTLAHGLNKKPELIITKVWGDSTYTDNWPVYHPAYGAGTYTYLNDPRAAPASYTGFFNGVEPDSSVFTVGSANSDNTKNLIAYCFTSVEGYSKIDSYTGNGSADGPFVYTGFRPAFILLKNITDGSTSWTIHDDKRLGYNPDNDLLFADTNGNENTTSYLDILSNGFKLRIISSFANASSKNFIYAAFAENPFKTARAR